ncbi:Asp-tRNA(Asn)/Glu-tRNA(Gln) amidotransferase subunit GatA [Sinanaerobacter chloroacetimidivorans]|uniref:Glutamyl-tRNA(Gln) amidotransferase subunit A n=1 Tax=Sinanaerobacter chloroacetimidivorans TaxID=2818044 RepID=A0A8J7W082_9FIRM|nr:Asp-tRNA(Asn)/Glu-tRNA(Gln) amidotransferase subunit GatA [Sinanaerobacter chloroacetimidivorans]MBR0598407.1 Asp-tRNA(Asn)/Glu-tRNA(Gln) amidotransferase subunit GatA [Sinanaerobacter chloroacetimidivorans]
MDIRSMTALEIGEKIRKREISSVEAAKAFLDAAKSEGSATNAYITVLEEEALDAAEKIQKRIDQGESMSPLAGVPVAVKDNLCTKGVKTTAGSKMLENFYPPYHATVIDKLSDAGAVILGKTNQDEFAMGGSTETSYYGITRNPWNTDCVPGGSSGGSAAAVAAKLAPYALGSDTGGSIRQPCAFCGLTGIKPTYGSVSRYGLLAYASSLDQIGPMGKDVKDCAAALSVISGYDIKDSTSILEKPFDFSRAFDGNIKGMKIGVPKNYFEIGISEDVKNAVLNAAKEFEHQGAIVEEFEIPTIEYAVPAYYIIACAEASSNLSRYDGIKFGYRSDQANDLLSTFYQSRSEGFGKEAKRRIMLGSFVLSSGYFDAYYKKALQVRGLIKESFQQAFQKYQVILSPVSPGTAYKIGEQISDPLAMYLADIYTVSINLAGLPAVALPCGFGENGMPVGMQLIGNAFTEETLIKTAYCYQLNTDYHTKTPDLVKNKESLPAKGGDR